MGIPENADLRAYGLTRRRRSKNSVGGIAPTAIGVLIKGEVCSVNAFRPLVAGNNPTNAGKLLMRLNFPRYTINGWLRPALDWLEGDT